MMISLIVRPKADLASRKRQNTGLSRQWMEWLIVSVRRRAPSSWLIPGPRNCMSDCASDHSVTDSSLM